MPSEISRRALVAGAAGGVGVVATGGYAWSQYAARNHLQFRSLEAVNESDEPVELTVAALSGGDVRYERTDELAPAGDEHGDDRKSLAGPWIKHPDPYSLRVELGEELLQLDNAEIVERLDGSGWGSDCANVTIVVTADRRLDSEVSPSDVC